MFNLLSLLISPTASDDQLVEVEDMGVKARYYVVILEYFNVGIYIFET